MKNVDENRQFSLRQFLGAATALALWGLLAIHLVREPSAASYWLAPMAYVTLVAASSLLTWWVVPRDQP